MRFCPIPSLSMYRIFTYIYHENWLKVGTWNPNNLYFWRDPTPQNKAEIPIKTAGSFGFQVFFTVHWAFGIEILGPASLPRISSVGSRSKCMAFTGRCHKKRGWRWCRGMQMIRSLKGCVPPQKKPVPSKSETIKKSSLPRNCWSLRLPTPPMETPDPPFMTPRKGLQKQLATWHQKWHPKES